jgi:hypothetical protein
MDIGVQVMLSFFALGVSFLFFSGLLMAIVGWVKDMLG